MSFNHEKFEKNIFRMGIWIAVVVSFGGLAQIVPLMFQAQVVQPLPDMKPITALELAGREVYVREGCYNCHSQMVRALRSETARYGHHSVAAESVWDHPFLWGSKRTGPDLARVGGRYSDDWHRVHLNNPRDVVPESNMPGFPGSVTTSSTPMVWRRRWARCAPGYALHRRRCRWCGNCCQRQDRDGCHDRLSAVAGALCAQARADGARP